MRELIDNAMYLKARGEHLEEVNRWLLDALDLVASLGDFPASVGGDQEPATILSLASAQLKRILAFRGLAFWLVEESDSDFVMASCEPESDRDAIRQEVEVQIEEGTFAWALSQNRAVMVPAKRSPLVPSSRT